MAKGKAGREAAPAGRMRRTRRKGRPVAALAEERAGSGAIIAAEAGKRRPIAQAAEAAGRMAAETDARLARKAAMPRKNAGNAKAPGKPLARIATEQGSPAEPGEGPKKPQKAKRRPQAPERGFRTGFRAGLRRRLCAAPGLLCAWGALRWEWRFVPGQAWR